jgi:hypothetical protein
MNRFRTIGLVAALALVAIGIWIAWSRSEPVYRGKPISYWVEPWRHTNETSATVKAAFDDMDDRAVEWLIQELKWKPSMLAVWINPYIYRWDMAFPDKPDPRLWAAVALSELGARAIPAIPALKGIAGSTGLAYNPAAFPARAALVRIRNEPVQNLFREVESGTRQSKGIVATFALTCLPEFSESSIPFLAGQLALTNPMYAPHLAAAALEEMASRPKDCVPQLIACLDSSDPILQGLALKALAAFGPNAANAVAKISTKTNNADPFVFRNATNALHRIQHGPPKIPFSWLKGLESH